MADPEQLRMHARRDGCEYKLHKIMGGRVEQGQRLIQGRNQSITSQGHFRFGKNREIIDLFTDDNKIFCIQKETVTVVYK